jgi:hypothetical protein
MLYLALEKEASNGYLPAYFVSILENGEEVIPVFLSRLHGMSYLRAHHHTEEFSLVSMDDPRLEPYRLTCQLCPDGGASEFPRCHVVLGLGDVKGERCMLWDIKSAYHLGQAFFSEPLLQEAAKTVFKNVLGIENYESFLAYELLTDAQLEALFNNAYMKTGYC